MWPKTVEVAKAVFFALKHVNIQFQPIIIIPNPSANASGIQHVVRHRDGTLEVDGQLYALQTSINPASPSSSIIDTHARTGSPRLHTVLTPNLVTSMGAGTFIPHGSINIKVQSPLIASTADEGICSVAEPGPEQQRENDFLQAPSAEGSEDSELKEGSTLVSDAERIQSGSYEKGSPKNLPHPLTDSDSRSQESHDSREDWISLH